MSTRSGDDSSHSWAQRPYYFKFRVIDQAEPNAFATPGGYIFISRGLLALVNSEDELAGILAHEISHVTLRHHARQAQRGVLPSVLQMPGRAIGAVVGEDVGEVINAPLAAAGTAYLSSYSRAQEQEADRAGLQLAARAGYDPAALARALDNLDRPSRCCTDTTARSSRAASASSTAIRPRRHASPISSAPPRSWRGNRPGASRTTGRPSSSASTP